MSDSAFERFQKLFEQAVELPADQRAAFLDEACAGDTDLRARIDELLAADAELEGFLEPPAGFGLPVEKLKQEAEGFLPEEEIGGYQLLRELGRGGRGVVYLARDPKTDEFVALKVLGMGMLPSAVAVERFRREAKAVARLSHPGVVRLVRAGEEPSRPYLVMEYIEGHTLADEILLQRHARDGVELPPHLLGCKPQLPTDDAGRYRAAVELVRSMADALGHAHERGVLHRDIKPQNVLLDLQGQPHMVDFGLAFVEGEQELTRTGDVEGTPNYMSPEQVRAERDRIDLRTDVYSLGVVLYELLTLRRPFDAPTANQVMQNITRTMPPRIRRVAPSVPDELEILCTTAIEKRRRDRYASMAVFRADLEAYLNKQPLQARRPGAITRSKRAIERRPMPYIAATAAAFALVVGAWGVRTFDRSQVLLAAHEAIDELEFEGAEPNSLDLRQALAAAAALDGGIDSLDSQRQARLKEARRLGREHAVAMVVDVLRDPELPMDGVSLAKSPFARDGTQSIAEWTDLGAQWGFEATEIAEFLREAREPYLVVDLEGADWTGIASASFGIPRKDTLGIAEWIPAETRFDHGIFVLPQQGQLILRLDFAGKPRVEVAMLETPEGSIRRLVVGVGRSSELAWVDSPASSMSSHDFSVSHDEPEEQIPVAALRVQQAPMSYGQFRRFAEAVGYSWRDQEHWSQAHNPNEFVDKPVGWVTLEEALACAAWYGVRLPWLPEREVAVRGAEMPLLPGDLTPEEYLAAMRLIPYTQDSEDWVGLDIGKAKGVEWMSLSLPDINRNDRFDQSAIGVRLGLAGVFELTMTNAGAAHVTPLGMHFFLAGLPAGFEADFSEVDDAEKRFNRLFEMHIPGLYQPDIGFRYVAPAEQLP